MKLIGRLLTAYVVLMAVETAVAQKLQLIWADEFDKNGPLDPQNWTYETGFVRNQELQWYQPDNALCDNGLLIIESRREPKRNPKYEPNSPVHDGIPRKIRGGLCSRV